MQQLSRILVRTGIFLVTFGVMMGLLLLCTTAMTLPHHCGEMGRCVVADVGPATPAEEGAPSPVPRCRRSGGPG